MLGSLIILGVLAQDQFEQQLAHERARREGQLRQHNLDVAAELEQRSNTHEQRLQGYKDTEAAKRKALLAAKAARAKFEKILAITPIIYHADIRNHTVSIGMPSHIVRLSWGTPNNINKTITIHGQSEQWCYNRGFLYFTNGVLTVIQN